MHAIILHSMLGSRRKKQALKSQNWLITSSTNPTLLLLILGVAQQLGLFRSPLNWVVKLGHADRWMSHI